MLSLSLPFLHEAVFSAAIFFLGWILTGTQVRASGRFFSAAWFEQVSLLAFIALLALLWLTAHPLNLQFVLLWCLLTQLLLLGWHYLTFWYQQRSAGRRDQQQPAWLVGYASQSGTAEQLARHSTQQLQTAGKKVQLLPLNALASMPLHNFEQALFIVSTYGEGEAPDNGQHFWRQALQQQPDLSQLKFAVLALGDRSYQHFCAFGHWLHNWLTQQHASAIQPLVHWDQSQRDSSPWQQWQQLLQKLGAGQAEPTDDQPWLKVPLQSRYCANPGSQGNPCFVIKLPRQDGMHWQAGDLLEIQPEHSRCTVALWLTEHKVFGCQTVRFHQLQIPLCRALAQIVLPQQGPSATENLEHWLQQQPLLPLRSYSIASIAEEDQFTLLVRQVKTAQGLGLGSGWLTSYALEGQPIQFRIRSHPNFHLPDDDRPMVFICNGTGIAGIRGLLAERVRRGHRQNWLLFGERQQNVDSFFAKDLQLWQQQGFLPELDRVFSRDGAEVRYVQHRLAERMPELKAWLEQGAAIYLCGSLHGMGQEVEQLLQTELSTEQLQALQQQGRYRRDLY
ncbi:sulfite reductase subunit alpha [Alkalimonas amylolytica]|uniref:NADPH--hemoprotein reductase n=1 Tax=Alkalimonas amylolytica TaxID=152573 RepID=A0A1H4D6Q4_ALKAM|nr:sulfite reductase subunit alpha [Alkalimonas amylolytica]SEA68414.1 sulfite reductase (NADPH) flavoprotein alpha-component [Alkalimonas amylolytica]